MPILLFKAVRPPHFRSRVTTPGIPPTFFRRVVSAAVVASLVAALAAGAQSVGKDSAALANLTGLERARALAKLVDAHKVDQPADALRYGAEALKLFAKYPDPAPNIKTLSEMLWPAR